MGKRSNFKRRERDFYPTPYEAVKPLLPYLVDDFDFIEPCAGDGALVERLLRSDKSLLCCMASDIDPQCHYVQKLDVFNDGGAIEAASKYADYIITNPPWDRKILHPMIDHFRKIAPTWLLFDADWMHTKQSADYMPYCHMIVSVGRVKWISDSKMTGKDNCAWYLFDHRESKTEFIGR